MKRKTLLAIYIVITSTLSVFGILVFLLLASGGNLKPSDLQGFISAYVPTIQLIHARRLQ